MSQHNNAWRLQDWISLQHDRPLQFNDKQSEMMTCLLPLLLCGEQSAQLVFNQEIARLNNGDDDLIKMQRQLLINALREVESDECRHDIALQQVTDNLPVLTDTIKVQRMAKRFYTQLGRVDNYQQHFVRIATLDTCVTHIMHAFEHGKLGRTHRFSQLCGLIKKDEAKHVYVSRHHAILLGATSDNFAQQQEVVSKDLFRLLTTQDKAFEHMGVCLDDLHKKLERKWQ
ncbi:hypothetical protein ACFOD0_14950 [Shewanella intestini]|uniref:3-oxoacyl-ACP synthase n=1 Tax=Shewanella intestini TaxID=2017544 RepID=A0ABS5I7Y3_9GAMM|nr:MULTISPECIES: hypothetical protein [Shewanella]MBR9729425.1 hypothetical protein [Shewanella intestini]MRG37505.1 hypothetical protein [Shewanella sp. XMDDZSB0408]